VKLSILAYGRAQHSPEAELTDRYLARIPWPATLSELADGAALPRGAPHGRTVLLDERGQMLVSSELAAWIGRHRDDGVRELRFAIGPADGFAEPARRAADLLLAFGRMTWPHLMVRPMLAEQLYRAWSILSGHPYHRA
jgi:23S rRNA (pseudouridine1915-N3)-methyltransferase